MSLTRGAAGQPKCVGQAIKPTGRIPNVGPMIIPDANGNIVIDAQRGPGPQANAGTRGSNGRIVDWDCSKGAPQPGVTDGSAFYVGPLEYQDALSLFNNKCGGAQIGANRATASQAWSPPVQSSVLIDSSSAGLPFTRFNGKIVSWNCNIPKPTSGSMADIGMSVGASLSENDFYAADMAWNSQCSKDFLVSQQQAVELGQIFSRAQQEDDALRNYLKPTKVKDFFGTSQCWSASQIQADSRATNVVITQALSQANGSGMDFMYCTTEDGKNPHLYSPSENRTCLASDSDRACHQKQSGRFASQNQQSALALVTNNPANTASSFNSSATGAALVSNTDLRTGKEIPIGSPLWTPPAGTRINPNGILGSEQIGTSGSDLLMAVTQDVGGVRLTTTCAIPTDSQTRSNLSNTFNIAQPFFMSARNGAGHPYCSPGVW